MLCIHSICTSKCSWLNRLSQERKKYRILHFTVERNWWRHTCRGDVGSNHRVHEWQYGHFLAYIPSWWKNQPSLVRVGGARPPHFTISTITWYTVSRTLQLRGQMIHCPYFYSTPLCTLWVKLTTEKNRANMSRSNLISSRIFFLWGWVQQALGHWNS